MAQIISFCEYINEIESFFPEKFSQGVEMRFFKKVNPNIPDEGAYYI